MDTQNRTAEKLFSMGGFFTTPRNVPFSIGIISIIAGTLVLWGWYTTNVILIQIRPDLAGMQYNTALCFLVSGMAVVALCKNYRLFPFLLGTLVFTISNLTLIQYIFNIDIGLDQLLMKAYLTAKASSPGRMGPNTALMFSLAGASLMILGMPAANKVYKKSLLFSGLILNSIILILGLVSIFGYLSDLPGTYGWGSYTQIAIHTACILTLLGIGLIFLTWIKATESYFSFSRWLPWFIFIMVEVLTLSFWQSSRAYVEKNILQQNEAAAANIKNILLEDLESRKEGLLHMAGRWEASRHGVSYEEWFQDALKYVSHQAGYQAIEWVDPKFHVRWVAPLKGNESVIHTNPVTKGAYAQTLFGAMKRNTATLTPILTLKTGDKGYLIYVPVEREKKFQGLIVGVVNARLFFDTIFGKFISGYHIAVSENNQLFYQYNNHKKTSSPVHSATVSIDEAGYSITLWPGLDLLKKQESWLPAIILVAGLFMALLLSVISRLAQIARKNFDTASQEIKNRRKIEKKLIVYSENLKKLTLLDSLTGTNNRRALSSVLKKEITQLCEKDASLSVLLLDIDYFKKINDTYGHVIGDQVLQKIGNILRTGVRAIDTVARYGGEEFCIVLPNTTNSQAHIIAERLRLLIAKQKFYCEAKEAFHLTCSIGVHQVTSQLEKIGDVFKVVDKALYTAKNSGRNCVVMV